MEKKMTENPRQDPMPDSNTPQASYPQAEAPTLQEGHDMQNSAASDAPLAAYASATDGASHPQAQQAVPPVGNVAAAYDFSYRRAPRQYEVPPEDRRPYGEPTGEIRGPGYFYSIGSFAASLCGLVLTGFSGFQVLGIAILHDDYDSLGYGAYEFTTISNTMLLALVPIVISIWLGIFSFTVNKGRITPMTGRMRAFASLGIVMGALGALGIVGNFFLYLLAIS